MADQGLPSLKKRGLFAENNRKVLTREQRQALLENTKVQEILELANREKL